MLTQRIEVGELRDQLSHEPPTTTTSRVSFAENLDICELEVAALGVEPAAIAGGTAQDARQHERQATDTKGQALGTTIDLAISILVLPVDHPQNVRLGPWKGERFPDVLVHVAAFFFDKVLLLFAVPFFRRLVREFVLHFEIASAHVEHVESGNIKGPGSIPPFDDFVLLRGSVCVDAYSVPLGMSMTISGYSPGSSFHVPVLYVEHDFRSSRFDLLDVLFDAGARENVAHVVIRRAFDGLDKVAYAKNDKSEE